MTACGGDSTVSATPYFLLSYTICFCKLCGPTSGLFLCMTTPSGGGRFRIVDLFAGAGGLSEGFASFRDRQTTPIFDIALSVENEVSAVETLRLRSFYRKFDGTIPREYRTYLAGEIDKKALTDKFPDQWAAACNEIAQHELGSTEARKAVNNRIDEIKDHASDLGQQTVLVGGPPCQAFSLIGRARNRAKIGYADSKDKRFFLYKEYIRILRRLKPAAFVFENVKGILSSMINGVSIFDQILDELRVSVSAENGYRLVPIVEKHARRHSEFVVQAEKFGIPQKRHRVIVLGIRADLADRLPSAKFSNAILVPFSQRRTVADALRGLPPLRSRLSNVSDGGQQWIFAAEEAFRIAAAACRTEGPALDAIAYRLAEIGKMQSDEDILLDRKHGQFVGVDERSLQTLFSNNYSCSLPNHETRCHMKADLARFAFAICFAEQFGTSPKSKDFPRRLAPNHANWTSGKFVDRFRVQCWNQPSTTVTSHIAKDGCSYIHPDPQQCRSLTVREAARLQTFPDDYYFEGSRTQQYIQVGNAVPPLLARQIAEILYHLIE